MSKKMIFYIGVGIIILLASSLYLMEWYAPLKNSGLSEDDILSKLTDYWVAKYPITSYWNIK